MNRSICSFTCTGWLEVRHDDQIVRQIVLDAVQLLLHVLAEQVDLLAGAHVDGQRDGAAAASTGRSGPRHVR